MNRTTTHVFYTEDLPSRCAAAIVRMWHAERGHMCSLMPRESGTTTRPLLDRLMRLYYPAREQMDLYDGDRFAKHDTEDHEIVLVSGDPLAWHGMIDGLDTWAYAVRHIDTGLRFSVCEQAWHDYFRSTPVPNVVTLLGRYAAGYDSDRTTHEAAMWHDEIIPLVVGLRMLGDDLLEPCEKEGWKQWQDLLAGVVNPTAQKMIRDGKLGYRALAVYGAAERVTDPVRRTSLPKIEIIDEEPSADAVPCGGE